MAMECRCYHGGEGRTRLKQLKFTGEDFKCLAVIAVALVPLPAHDSLCRDWRKNQPPCGRI